jgi:hypothetical protein
VRYLISDPWDIDRVPPIMDRFLRQALSEDACWRWPGALDREGYGKVNIFYAGSRRTVPAHRVAYIIEVGPIPEGMALDHTCRVRNCVNPRHLDPVSIAENNRRAALVAS